MLKKVLSSLFFALVTTSLCACGASVDEYKKFSQAGRTYSLALEGLLVKSAEITIDRTSEDLLTQDISGTDVTKAEYNSLSRDNKKTLKSVDRLITQTRLLRSYFSKLEDLASSNSSNSASNSTKSIVDSISKLSSGLKKEDQTLNGFIPSIVKISISSQIRQALRNELELRGNAILESLEIQEVLISALSRTIDVDTRSIADSRELRNVIPPITSKNPIANPDEWINLRRATLTSSNTIIELTEASQSLSEFKSVFKAILEDKLTSARIDSFIKEADEFIKIVEKNKPMK
jgi:NPH3 family